MPRNVTLAAMQAALAQETDKVFLVLVEVAHENLPTPVRLVNNTENIVHQTHTYTAFPFHATMPDDRDDREPVAELIVANVTRELIEEIRNIKSDLFITLKVILASSPNSIEWGPIEMEVHNIVYNADSISFQLGMQAFSKEPFPWKSFTPVKFPGLFKR